MYCDNFVTWAVHAVLLTLASLITPMRIRLVVCVAVFRAPKGSI